MTTLRDAAQQALAALCKVHPVSTSPLAEHEWAKAIRCLCAALAESQPEPEHTRKDGNYKVLYRCEDCGHEQRVFEIVANGRTYAGSGANWCDACGDGLPLRVVETAHDIGDDE